MVTNMKPKIPEENKIVSRNENYSVKVDDSQLGK